MIDQMKSLPFLKCLMKKLKNENEENNECSARKRFKTISQQ